MHDDTCVTVNRRVTFRLDYIIALLPTCMHDDTYVTVNNQRATFKLDYIDCHKLVEKVHRFCDHLF